jgi:hypothetical protein
MCEIHLSRLLLPIQLAVTNFSAYFKCYDDSTKDDVKVALIVINCVKKPTANVYFIYQTKCVSYILASIDLISVIYSHYLEKITCEYIKFINRGVD